MSKKEEKIKKRREKVKELYEEGKTNQEIANILKVSKQTVANDIYYLKGRGEITGKIEERREKVKELYKAGKTSQEIADILGISKQTVKNDIYYLRKQGEITGKERKEIIEKRREKVKELDKQGNKKESKRYKRIKLYIRECIKQGEIQQAIDYAKSHENSMHLTENEQKKMKEFIQQTELKQVKTILELCEVGKTQREILEITKFSEGLIYEVYDRYRRKQEEDKEK
ncbi:MAG: HTH domain-containing protein [Clostridia bacterium]|nr:HTH domain-containing protein [Clostridia bacterium]